jgi:hypothetical protein
VRDAVVTAGFRSHVGPIERPASALLLLEPVAAEPEQPAARRGGAATLDASTAAAAEGEGRGGGRIRKVFAGSLAISFPLLVLLASGIRGCVVSWPRFLGIRVI